jgi:hypothetical protein
MGQYSEATIMKAEPSVIRLLFACALRPARALRYRQGHDSVIGALTAAHPERGARGAVYHVASNASSGASFAAVSRTHSAAMIAPISPHAASR